MNTIRSGIYLHYKGNLYRVLTIAKHTENDDDLVIYHPLNDQESLWARPINVFTDTLLHGDQLIPRFRFIRRFDHSADEIQIKTKDSIS